MDSHEPLPETADPPLQTVIPSVATAHLRDVSVTVAYSEYADELYGFLHYAVRDPEAARDLLQDVFLRLLGEVRKGAEPENTRAWLYRVAANLAVSRGRRLSVAARHVVTLGRQRRESEPSPDVAVLRRESDRELDAVLARLPADSRTALLLRGRGFAPAEIAASLGRSEGATRTLLSRSRVKLRLLLEESGSER